MLPPALLIGPPALVKVVPVLEKFPPKVVTGAPTATVAPTPDATRLTLSGDEAEPEMSPPAEMVIVPPLIWLGIRLRVVVPVPALRVIGALTVMVPAWVPVALVVVMVTLLVASAAEMVSALTIAAS